VWQFKALPRLAESVAQAGEIDKLDHRVILVDSSLVRDCQFDLLPADKCPAGSRKWRGQD
jgi:hypothetical protein